MLIAVSNKINPIEERGMPTCWVGIYCHKSLVIYVTHTFLVGMQKCFSTHHVRVLCNAICVFVTKNEVSLITGPLILT